MDDKISTPPLESYFGANVGKLSQIKAKFDPQGFFTNVSRPASWFIFPIANTAESL